MIFLKKKKKKKRKKRKVTRKYDIYFKCSEKMVFSKRIVPRHDLFCNIWKGGIFFPQNMVFFPWTENERGVTFRKIYTEAWYFLFDMFNAPCEKKNQRGSYPAKIHLKVINISDWYPRKSSRNILYLHGDLYRRFHIYCSLAKKIRKLNI